LNIARTEGDRVVAIDIARGLKAKDVVEIDPFRAPVHVREMICLGETGIVLVEIGLVEETVGILDGGDVVSAEGLNETILMGTVGAFDSALGLGRVCMDDVHAEP
jgi:hypothetical protein